MHPPPDFLSQADLNLFANRCFRFLLDALYEEVILLRLFETHSTLDITSLSVRFFSYYGFRGNSH